MAIDSIELFTKAAAVFDDYVRQIKPDQLDDQTPATEWKVRDLLNHVLSEQIWIPDMLAGKTIAEVGSKYDGDLLGQDPQAAWQQAYKAGVASFNAPGAAAKTVHLSFGDTPALAYAEQMFMDHIIHSWDLAKGIGAAVELPQDLVQECYNRLKPQAEDWRSGGAFGKEIKLDDDGTVQDKLLALTGRDPNWRPPVVK